MSIKLFIAKVVYINDPTEDLKTRSADILQVMVDKNNQLPAAKDQNSIQRATGFSANLGHEFYKDKTGVSYYFGTVRTPKFDVTDAKAEAPTGYYFVKATELNTENCPDFEFVKKGVKKLGYLM